MEMKGQPESGTSGHHSRVGPEADFHRIGAEPSADMGGLGGCCAGLLTFFAWLLIIITFPFSLFFCFKGYSLLFLALILTEKLISEQSHLMYPHRKIANPTISITNVEDSGHSTRLLAQTTLRNILGTKTLSEILADREQIAHFMQSYLDDATDPWGVKVERVEVKDVRLPTQLQRAMAAEAESTREARAKVIAAEGEQKASRALKEAAEVISQSPAALQLRYLQTLSTISAEKNSTIIFPVPVDLVAGLVKK